MAAGRDPIAERLKEAEPTFGECADQYLTSMEASWRNAKHRAQWAMTLTEYCTDIRPKRVSQIGTDDVLRVLKPIWEAKPETASRLRGRIERVLDFAKAKGWRSGENPALWRGHLKNVLPSPKEAHPRAPPCNALSRIFQTSWFAFKSSDAMAARALEFLILCAARSGEVYGARWTEFDFDRKVWTIPGDRMKAGKEHRVPLTAQALAVLRQLHEARASDFVFFGHSLNKQLSSSAMEMLLRRMNAKHVTVHGFRSSFRDWAGDETAFPREIAEVALAHRIGDATEQAYRRADALERRRALMQAWADFLRPD